MRVDNVECDIRKQRCYEEHTESTKKPFLHCTGMVSNEISMKIWLNRQTLKYFLYAITCLRLSSICKDCRHRRMPVGDKRRWLLDKNTP